MSPESPLIPANLKELSLLRKVAKKLGLKRTATGDQVLRELNRRPKLKAAVERDVAIRGEVELSVADLARLQASIDQVVALLPVASAAGQRKPAALALPGALEALRDSHAGPSGGNDGAGAIQR